MGVLLVFAGSGTGGILRYLIARLIPVPIAGGFPIATLLANLVGCFMIGLLAGVFEVRPVSPNLRLLLFTGLLGGFTTFSAFGLESFTLFRTAGWRPALFYILLTNLCGLGLAVAGWSLGHRIR